MDARQIQLVQQTFAAVEKDATAVGTLFYHRMFEMDPSLQALFKGDMKQQATMLMTSLGMAVKGLDKQEEIVPQLNAIGSRHGGYGVAPRDFDTFSAALMWTLEQSLADAFTEEVHHAWIDAFEFIRLGMKQATR